MGERLRRTALSTNVRERLDFSCALLDADGQLVVNAPHVPVHLGALGLCVRSVAERLDLGPGDVAVTNHPAFGGSHLPDVTTVSPVHAASGERVGWVASRAHHAEIGGTRPGSMPPGATRLVEEGVVLRPFVLVRGGEADRGELERRLRGATWPSRAVAENLADVEAALAANARGAARLAGLADAWGAEAVRRTMSALTERAAAWLEETRARWPSPPRSAVQRLDDGSEIRVTVGRTSTGFLVDFEGSSDVHPGNLNATPAIVRSAVLYVLRLLVGRPLPLNEGLLRDVDLRIPTGLLSPPFPDDDALAPAVVGGNVETSQRVVDCLLDAFGLVACSQGTMNNVLFGTDTFGYYETVGGGAGAGPGFHGASGVHTHMTNTAITDPEVLEQRYPVRVERFGLRRGSGGRGRWRGGDGLVRELRFLAPVRLSVLSQHRIEAPYGRDGGEAGLRGRQRIVRDDGTVHELAGCDSADLAAGDRLVMETPGGGGWGQAEEDEG